MGNDTFEWVLQPLGGVLDGTTSVDGSYLYTELHFAGFRGLRDWALAAADQDGRITAIDRVGAR